MSAKLQTWLWILQRKSAGVLALCVLVHLATMIVAIRGGLSAAEILGRTRGNVAWLAFYTVFVLSVAVHAPIGMRTILGEWLGWRGASRDWLVAGLSVALAALGLRAVIGVFG